MRAGARSIASANGSTWPMGNGNLWYTVSQDQASGRHTVRWETYTSFNMPSEIRLGNLAPASTSTPATLSGYTCPSGYTLQGTTCSQSDTSTTSATPVHACPSGFTLSGTTCTRSQSVAATATAQCPSTGCGSDGAGNQNLMLSWCSQRQAEGFQVLEMDLWAPFCRVAPKTVYSCPAGSTLSGTNCLSTSTQTATVSSYTCPAGSVVSGGTCVTTTTRTEPAAPVYSCPAGLGLNGSTCTNPTATVAERTLRFAYGPEHQRIRQTVELTSSAPSHMQAGTTWYLNGTDSQGLTYEKEVKANGTTEHKHYLSAAGITFAMYVKREGSNLNGQPAASVRYFHQDHLGSIAAISDENGQLVERLAYDPWGKRRNTNGTPDPLDALYGISTDRGYTEHEHLDEMGIVHMNGRIYDPLIGRFMSADPFIQAPGNLQSYNRYAYVLNNPLAYTDPSGHFWQIALYVFIGAEVAKQLGVIDKGMARAIQGIAAAFMVGQWATAAGYGKVAAGVMGGFTGGFVGSNGNIEAGIVGGMTGGMFAHVGMTYKAGSFGSYAGHAVVGCISTVAKGGGCGSGAASALFGKFTSHELIGGVGENASLGEVIGKGVAGGAAVAAGLGYLADRVQDLSNVLSVEGADGVEKPAGVPDNWREEPTKDGVQNTVDASR